MLISQRPKTPAELLAELKTVDGDGSGLDADTLDGNSSSAFAGASHHHDSVYAKLADVPGNALNAVGSYALMVRIDTNTQIVAGNTYPGTSLTWADVDSVKTDTGRIGGNTFSTPQPSGIWRALGFSPVQGGNVSATLFVKVSD